MLPSVVEIQSALSAAPTSKDRSYAAAFRERNDVDSEVGWNLLAQLFDFHFKPSDPAEPFGPMLVMDGKRSMIPDDLTAEQLDELQATLARIKDPEFKSRVGDILWLRRRDAAAARVAVTAYLEAGARLEDPEHWVPAMERYERAARLARQVEPKGICPNAHLLTWKQESDTTMALIRSTSP